MNFNFLRSPGKFLARLLTLVFFLVCSFLFLHLWLRPSRLLFTYILKNHGYAVQDLEAQKRFWQSFQPLLVSSQPDCKSPERKSRAKGQKFNASHDPPRPELLSLSDEDVEKMRQSHAVIMKGIDELPPRLVYTPKTRGLVSTAASKYLPMLVVSLRMIRLTGSVLPMEVFVASQEEYEAYACEEILPSLNAKCVILSRILDSSPKFKDLKGYQLMFFV